MLNRPLYYNLFLVTCKCHTCNEEYTSTEIMLAREIPRGEAFSPPAVDAPLYDIPVHKKEIRRDIPFCPMCVDAKERTPVPVPDNRRLNYLGGRDAIDLDALGLTKPMVELDLAALGLLD